MKLTIVKFKIGTKVFQDGKHIKTIPGRYNEVLRSKHIINPKRKRLTQEERFKLEVAVFEFHLKTEMRLVYDLIKKSVPKAAQQVTDRDEVTRSELIYKNGKRLRCPPPFISALPKSIETKIQ